MAKKLDLSNSIYQRQGSKSGLTVKDGMLLNNQIEDGETLIQAAGRLKKSTYKGQKVDISA